MTTSGGLEPRIHARCVPNPGYSTLSLSNQSLAQQLVSHLNDFVVGQERAKRVLAVAVYNHYTRLNSLAVNTSPPLSPDIPREVTEFAAAAQLPATGWIPYKPTTQELRKARKSWEKSVSPEQRAESDLYWGKARADPAEEQTEPTSASIRPKPKSARGTGLGKEKNSSGSSEDGSIGQQWFKNADTGLIICVGGAGPPPVEPEQYEDPTLYDSVPHDQDSLLMPFTDENGTVIRPVAPAAKDKQEEDKASYKDKDKTKSKKHDKQHEPLVANGTATVAGQIRDGFGSPFPSTNPLPRLPIMSEGPPSQNVHDLKAEMKRREAIYDQIRSHLASASSPRSKQRPSQNSEAAFEKSNVLLLGPTGSGKSLLARTLARALDVPFVSVEATSMTSAGYVGEDVESAVARLVEAADGDIEKAARGIIFIDEIDKISSSGRTSKDVGGEGVQQALLKMLEGTLVNVSEYNVVEGGSNGRGLFGMTKKGPSREQSVDTTNILFIVAGAFVGLEKIVQARISKGSIGFTSKIAPSPSTTSRVSDTPGKLIAEKEDVSHLLDEVEPSDLVSFGLIPEFIGRLPITAALKSLTENDLLRILTEPKNALVRQYQELFHASGVELKLTTAALKAIAQKTVSKGTGARGLRRLMENILLDSMFDAPQSSIRYVLITKAVVDGQEPAGYFSRAEKWKFDQIFADEDNEGNTGTGSSRPRPDDVEDAFQEAEKRDQEKIERAEKRRKKLAAAA
ncbi:Mcx1p [Sporobolomyces koalae]|uniref:Mcx1p n=1 Tax=Sporobolomyces koalae TaxID=500713 RepID=UPI0031704A68